MKVKYCCTDDRSFLGDLLWFQVETRGKEDFMMENFIKEIELNMKHQFGYVLNTTIEDDLKDD